MGGGGRFGTVERERLILLPARSIAMEELGEGVKKGKE